MIFSAFLWALGSATAAVLPPSAVADGSASTPSTATEDPIEALRRQQHEQHMALLQGQIEEAKKFVALLEAYKKLFLLLPQQRETVAQTEFEKTALTIMKQVNAEKTDEQKKGQDAYEQAIQRFIDKPDDIDNVDETNLSPVEKAALAQAKKARTAYKGGLCCVQ